MIVGEDLGQEGGEGDRGGRSGHRSWGFLGEVLGELLVGEEMVGDQAGVEGEGSKEAAGLSGGGLQVRIGHERLSLSVERSEILPIGGKEGLSCTSSAEAKF